MRPSNTVDRFLGGIRRFFSLDEGYRVRGSPRTRMVVVSFLVLLGLGAVVAKAAVQQTKGIGEEMPIGVTDIIELKGERGRILDRSGRVVFAAPGTTKSVVFVGAPFYVDRTEMAYALGEALGLDPEDLLRKLRVASEYAVVKNNVTEKEAAIVEKLNLVGVRVEEREGRVYPNGSLAGPIIGNVLDGEGQRGIEATYNDDLSERSASLSVMRDAVRQGLVASRLEDLRSLDGDDVVLNLDFHIQMVLEAELQRVIEEEKATGAMGVVMDPYTFEVLAMASLPSMDPGQNSAICKDFEDPSRAVADVGANPCRNKVVSFVFEPGSVGKVFAVTAGLEAKRVSLETPLDGQMGTCKVGKFTVTDVKKVGVVPLRDAVKYSSNCALSELGRMLGPRVLHDTLVALGLGSRTGIDLPGEATGYVRPVDKWGQTDAMVAAYGYSYRVTVIQIARAIAAIANGGILGTPRVAREIRARDGSRGRPVKEGERRRVISEKTAAQVREVMRAVVMEDGGTGVSARPKGYSAAGKTGTAETTVGARWQRRKVNIMTFAGFAPAEDPKIVVVVSVVGPKKSRFAGQVAAPVFRSVVEKALPLLGVEPKVEVAKKGS